MRDSEILVNGVTRYIKEIRRITERENPVAVARNRGKYLLAVTSGSARNGLLHNADRPSNPLLDAMRSRRIATSEIKRVASSDGMYLSTYDYMFPRFHRSEDVITDGEMKVVSEIMGEDVDSRYDPKYPLGNAYSRREIQVSNSTFVIIASRSQSEFNVGPSNPTLVGARVLLTPKANIREVAQAFQSIA